MQRIKIITPDPIVETLLAFLTKPLMDTTENTVLLDAAWLRRPYGQRMVRYSGN